MGVYQFISSLTYEIKKSPQKLNLQSNSQEDFLLTYLYLIP